MEDIETNSANLYSSGFVHSHELVSLSISVLFKNIKQVGVGGDQWFLSI